MKAKIFGVASFTVFFVLLFISVPFVLAEEKGELVSYRFLSKPVTLDPNIEEKKRFSTNISFFTHSSIQATPKLIIEYEVSHLNDIRTGVVVFLDGQPIYTLVASPDHLNGQTQTRVVIPLPQVDGSKRIHHIEFAAGTGRKVTACEKKYENEWIVIKSSSRIEVTYERRSKSPVTLRHFPWSLQTPEKEPIFVVRPDNHTKEDDTMFIQTISFLSRQMSLEINDVLVGTESEFYANPIARNVLFIGVYEHFQERTKKMLRQMLPIERETQNMLAVIRSPFDSQQFLYVLSSLNIESSRYINKMLNRQAFLKSLNGQFIEIKGQESSISTTRGESVKSTIKISEIGYKDGISIKNVQETGTASFQIQLENGVILEEGSQVVIYYSYNDTFSEERSTLTVSVNQIPVSTVLLKRGEGERASIKVKIPVTELKKQKIVVDLTFAFKENETECEDVLRNDGWARILPDSYFDFTYKNRELYSLNFFPYPLLKDFKWNNVAFVLPTNATSSYYQQIANIVILLGKYVQKDDTGVYLLRENELGDEKRNIVLYHTSSKSKNNIEQQVGEKFRELKNRNEMILYHLTSKEGSRFFMLVSSLNSQLLSRSYELFRIDEWREKIEAFDSQKIHGFAYNEDEKRVIVSEGIKENKKIISFGKKVSMLSYVWNEKTLMKMMQFLLIISTIMLIVRIWFDKKRDE